MISFDSCQLRGDARIQGLPHQSKLVACTIPLPQSSDEIYQIHAMGDQGAWRYIEEMASPVSSLSKERASIVEKRD
jgi:hypothetical protein